MRKFKDKFVDFFKGVGIGIACIVPGVSGGTLAVIFNLFNKIIDSINNLFKHFKESFFTLLPILLGVAVGVGALIIPINKGFEYIPFVIVCLFVGFIIGGLPSLFPKVNKKLTLSGGLSFTIALALVVGLNFIPGLGNYDLSTLSFGICLITILMGFVASFALVVPGISGSMMLLVLGFYSPLMITLERLLKFQDVGHNIVIVILFAIGVLVGFFVVSKLIGLALVKVEYETYMAIIGFILGSIFSLYYQFVNPLSYKPLVMFPSWAPTYVHIILSVVCFIVGLALSLYIVFYSFKKKGCVDGETNKTR